jgi:hypothetical protein
VYFTEAVLPSVLTAAAGVVQAMRQLGTSTNVSFLFLFTVYLTTLSIAQII